MLWGFLIGCKKGGMGDGMNLPPGGDTESESCAGDDFLYFKGTYSFHLEFLWSIHVEVGSFEPDLVSHLPGSKLRGYPFSHPLLGYFVGSLGIFTSGG